MPVPYGNLAPTDLIAQLGAVNPSGAGLSNPPALSPVLEKLGIVNNPFVRKATDLLYSDVRKAKRNQDKLTSNAFGQTDTFVQHVRRPFVLTCQKWIEQKDPRYLYCSVNPRAVQWSLGLRTSDQKTLAGTVQHAWRQNLGVRRNTYFSEPSITITFQSGNTMPVTTADPTNPNLPNQDKKIPTGLSVFYNFVDLLGDSRIIEGGGDRRANVVYIMYTSRLYPSIVLAGMFNPDGFSFNDAAESPNSVEWTAGFTVYDSYPRFDHADGLIRTWNQIQPLTKYVEKKKEEAAANNGSSGQPGSANLTAQPGVGNARTTTPA